eukprot:GHUV01021168.1.p1 GENE.GHUV01021168.1~~GHUV01021168.1.p1  ORF type:complete len:229 (+),score=52.28 GHUV01021168.1:1231-1917(+)
MSYMCHMHTRCAVHVTQGLLGLTGTSVACLQATFLYASLLRQLAHQCIQDLLGLSPGSAAVPLSSDPAAAAVATAVGYLRQAAGVYEHLAEVMLPPLFTSMNGDRPAEILARCNTAMSQLSLAEAQALTAFRAQHKGTSPGVVASLHAGAAELYEKAAKSIRDYIGECYKKETCYGKKAGFVLLCWQLMVCMCCIVQQPEGSNPGSYAGCKCLPCCLVNHAGAHDTLR